MKKSIVLAVSVFALALTSSLASAQTVYKCYESPEAKPLQAKIVNGTIVSVKYKGQKTAIPLTSGSQEANGSELNEIYLEKYNGKITGRYTFSNSANAETLQYERMKDGKFFYFELSQNTYVNNAYRKTPCF